MSGELVEWSEYPAVGLITVKSDSLDLMYLETNSEHDVKECSLHKVKIGTYSTSNQERGKVIGTAFINSIFHKSLLTVSRDGAIFSMKLIEENEETEGIVCERSEGYICRHCLTLFLDGQKCREHVLRQHVGPALCVMCGGVQEDMMALRNHKKTCGFPCQVTGCNLLHKSSISAANHKKKFLKSVG